MKLTGTEWIKVIALAALVICIAIITIADLKQGRVRYENGVELRLIDGHWYIKSGSGDHVTLTHSASCTNH